jgi:hypothetical protein
MSQEGWVEPRGPHLPDTITRTPLGVWPFLAVAVLAAYGRVSLLGQESFASPANVLWVIAGTVEAVAAPLLGAALFYRHPRAHRTVPAVAFGTVLFAFTTVVDALREPVMNSIAPPPMFGSLGEGFVTLASTGYSAIEALLLVFALTYLAIGLGDARQFKDRRSGRPIMLGLLLCAVGAPLAGGILASPWPAETTNQIVVGLTAQLLTNLAWAYLGWTAYRGWRADEEPNAGWGLVALAAIGYVVVVIVFALLSVVLWIIGPTETQVPLIYEFAQVLTLGLAAFWLALLAAFWLGLPAEPDHNDVAPSDELEAA